MKPGIRGTLVCCAVVAALFAAGSAFAASQTIVAADNTFSQTIYTMDQGERPILQNIGFNQHNATATANGPDGKPLFSSPTIGMGTTTLNGTQYLTTGSYTFVCTVHPSTMIATLAVSANGTPVSRPALTLKLLSKNIEKVLKSGLLVRIDTTAKSDDITIEARLGKTLIASDSDHSAAQGRTFAQLRLSKAGKSKLRKREKATIQLSGTIPSGAPTTSRGKLK